MLVSDWAQKNNPKPAFIVLLKGTAEESIKMLVLAGKTMKTETIKLFLKYFRLFIFIK